MKTVRIEFHKNKEYLLVIDGENQKQIDRQPFRDGDMTIVELLKSTKRQTPHIDYVLVDVSTGEDRIMWDSSDPFKDYSEPDLEEEVDDF